MTHLCRGSLNLESDKVLNLDSIGKVEKHLMRLTATKHQSPRIYAI
jgi:hypothetical protein